MNNRSVYKHFIVAIGLLALGACAGNSPHYVVTVPGDCCDSFDTMAFKELPADKRVRLVIDSDDMGFKFEGGYSHYEALSLPEIAQPYILQIESEVVREGEDNKGKIIVSEGLDANYQDMINYAVFALIHMKEK